MELRHWMGGSGVIYTLFVGFYERSGNKHLPPPIPRFREIVFKIPLFSWNLEHTLDPKCSRRVATGSHSNLKHVNSCYHGTAVVWHEMWSCDMMRVYKVSAAVTMVMMGDTIQSSCPVCCQSDISLAIKCQIRLLW